MSLQYSPPRGPRYKAKRTWSRNREEGTTVRPVRVTTGFDISGAQKNFGVGNVGDTVGGGMVEADV